MWEFPIGRTGGLGALAVLIVAAIIWIIVVAVRKAKEKKKFAPVPLLTARNCARVDPAAFAEAEALNATEQQQPF